MRKIRFIILQTTIVLSINFSIGQSILDKQKTLDKFSFWSNQDWAWYKTNIPFLETPDKEIDRTYYYRWELATMHLVYGSPESGYASTEFIDRPWWSGEFGTISCPAGHQLYDFRWFKNPRYAQDYANFWFKNSGAQPQNYTNWIADAIWQSYKVYKNFEFTTGLLPDLKTDYYKWENKFFVEEEGMFAWDGMHDGMETNINSRQTEKWFDGAPGYRPTLNSYMWAGAKSISNIAALTKDIETVNEFESKAKGIKSNFQAKNWDVSRNFFFHRFKNDELTANKQDTIKANTLTYQDGLFKGNSHGRELIGYIPWYFNMIDDTKKFATAWQYIMDPNFFYADFGPTVVERNDPLFKISEKCCEWSGNSWPFATSQTLKAMSNVLNNYENKEILKKDFFTMFMVYTMSHRKNGKPYIAEALHPDSGSWSGHDVVGHSEHYYHSSYIDLVIADLIGIKPQADNSILIQPLVPENWKYFILEDVMYHGNLITILWDKNGSKYGQGKGFKVISNGEIIAASEVVEELKANITYKQSSKSVILFNYAVNNSNVIYPKLTASFNDEENPVTKINDGQYWYLTPTTNQWSTINSKNKKEWVVINFGKERKVENVIAYFVEDEDKIKAPKNYKLHYWKENRWKAIPNQKRQYKNPMARKGNKISFDEIVTSKIKVELVLHKNNYVGISELETWGEAD